MDERLNPFVRLVDGVGQELREGENIYIPTNKPKLVGPGRGNFVRHPVHLWDINPNTRFNLLIT